MGWIFYKPNYERMELVDREDLDSDPSECFDFIWQEVVLPSFSCPFPA
jgi:stearoyl-CoA desaturase (delta-9 desaturase)